MLNRNLIVVIGAGSTGSSTAYNLAKKGARVVLIDRGQVASGMTSLSSAIVRTHYSNEIVARMVLYSLRVFQNPGDIGDFGFVNSKLILMGNSEYKDIMLENVRMLKRLGIKEETITKDEAMRVCPEVDFEGLDFFVFEPESGYADPSGTANAYAAKAREMGVQTVLGKEVARIETQGGSASSVLLSDGTRIKCEKVVLCTNIWTNRLLESSGVNKEDLLPILAGGHPIVMFKRPDRYQGQQTIVWDIPASTYYKPEGKSLMSVGSLDEPDDKHPDPDECSLAVPDDEMNRFTELTSKRIPVMAQGTFHSSYVGMYDVTPDEHPIIDELGEIGLPSVFCCVGLSGHGFKLCPAYGLINAEMVLGVERNKQTFDRARFSLSRFKRGDLFKVAYQKLKSVG